MLDIIVKHLKGAFQDFITLLYNECGCCGRQQWDVQRREGFDDYTGISFRDLYGVLCDDCYEDLKEHSHHTKIS